MRSTFHGLEVAKSGLYAQQTALSVTGHNIANANTVGFTRQQVVLTNRNPIETPSLNRTMSPGQLGTGVSIDSIKRVRESFLDDQFRNESQALGSWAVRKDTLEKIELIFNEPSNDGLQRVIDEFWNAWQDLSREPDNLTARAVVRERTLAMLDAFKHTDNKLKQLSEDLTTGINIKTGEANTYINQLAQLNQEIRRIEGLGDNANDLRDQRDLLADKLSRIVQIQVREDAGGMYNISLPSGEQLVNGLQATLLGDDGVNISSVTGGELHGMRLSRDEIVASYQSHLNAMLEGIISGPVQVRVPEGSVLAVDVTYTDVNGNQVTLEAGKDAVPTGGITIQVNGINGIHQLAWSAREDANGNALGGLPLFDLGTGSFNIQNVNLNSAIMNDSGRIAASFRVEGRADGEDGPGRVIVGNSEMALMMGQLRNAKFNFNPQDSTSGVGTFDEYFRSVLGVLGVQTQEATRQTNNQSIILHSVENRRQSMSGVSLDEEMANLIKFQHAYNASARMLTTLDQIYDTIINRLGVVGR